MTTDYRKYIGKGKSECTDEGPALISSIFLVIACLSFGGTALAYGDEIRRASWQEKGAPPGNVNQVPLVVVLVLALLMQLFAVYYYYNCYRRCAAMQGFLVYIIITAFTGFVATIISQPPEPRCFSCDDPEPHNPTTA
jgi:hypothetical protein